MIFFSFFHFFTFFLAFLSFFLVFFACVLRAKSFFIVEIQSMIEVDEDGNPRHTVGQDQRDDGSLLKETDIWHSTSCERKDDNQTNSQQTIVNFGFTTVLDSMFLSSSPPWKIEK